MWGCRAGSAENAHSALTAICTAKTATGRYTGYFNDAETSDVNVVIEVAQSGENLVRKHLRLQGNVCESAIEGELCAHSLILRGNSPVWKVQHIPFLFAGRRVPSHNMLNRLASLQTTSAVKHLKSAQARELEVPAICSETSLSKVLAAPSKVLQDCSRNCMGS